MQLVIASAARLFKEDGGQDLIEYGLLAALIATAAVIAVTTLGDTITAAFWNNIAGQNF